MFGHDIIVLGASTGGVEALSRLVAELPKDLPAAVFVVLHIPRHGKSHLPEILSRVGRLPAVHPRDGAAIAHGRIYIAPPDFHLLVMPGRVRVVRGPTENRHRPAVDTLFRSAARAYGARVTGVVLTGALDDGTAGLRAIKRHGGMAIVQDPADAMIPSMPESALEFVSVDYCLPLTGIAPRLIQLAHEEARQQGGTQMPTPDESEVEISELRAVPSEKMGELGKPSIYTCPECNGPLWEIQDGDLVRYRCRVGHAFTSESLLAGQSEEVEAALWEALNTLEASETMARQMARQARARNHAHVTERFETRAREAVRRAETIRQVLLHNVESADTEATEDADEEQQAAGQRA